MLDQANHLRELVLAGSRGARAFPAQSPQLIVICGAKGGVGTTCVAANVAVALAQDGRRTLLVDADLEGGDTAAMFRLSPVDTIADVLSGRRTVHEAIQAGPAGVQVLAGAWGLRDAADCSPPAQQRLLSELHQIGAFVDYVILDVGSGLNRVVQRFWRAADQTVLVTTTDSLAVMDAYAALKVLAPADADESRPTHVLVNMSQDDAAADEVHRRLETACRRFLGHVPDFAEPLPVDAALAEAVRRRRPAAVSAADAPAVRRTERLASRLVAHSAEAPADRSFTGSPPGAAAVGA